MYILNVVVAAAIFLFGPNLYPPIRGRASIFGWEMDSEKLKARYNNGIKIFSRVPGWIIERCGLDALKGTEAKILIFIGARIGNKTDSVKITLAEISEATGIGKNKISELTKNLVMMGILKIEKQGRENTYLPQFHPPPTWPACAAINFKKRKAAPGRRSIINSILNNKRDMKKGLIGEEGTRLSPHTRLFL